MNDSHKYSEFDLQNTIGTIVICQPSDITIEYSM